MKVYMIPELSNFDKNESGIKQVVQAYHRYAPRYGIQYVTKGEKYDLIAVHAGMATRFDVDVPLVAHLHGVYWTADYMADTWEWKANATVVNSIVNSTVTTVPSEWVAETFERDMRFSPVVIHHGIEWKEWQHDYRPRKYALWNKNRNADVCSPADVGELAKMIPSFEFKVTFAPTPSPKNITEIGLQPHEQMKKLIQEAAVYISIAKETFGIGALEALASGTPVLGYAHGGNLITVQHGVNGYLARPNDIEDLANGLDYCLKYRSILSANARETAKQWTWDEPVKKVAEVYQQAIDIFNDRKRPHRI